MRYAEVINEEVMNVILWDGVSPYAAEGELILIPAALPVSIGWRHEDGQFYPPE